MFLSIQLAAKGLQGSDHSLPLYQPNTLIFEEKERPGI